MPKVYLRLTIYLITPLLVKLFRLYLLELCNEALHLAVIGTLDSDAATTALCALNRNVVREYALQLVYKL